MKPFHFLLMLILLASSCTQPEKSFTNVKSSSDQRLDKVWFQGKAEINVFDLKQSRYKDQHPGEAIMIFVTEDFLTDKQVKNDRYQNENSTGILKNNQIRRFTTGVYDYSMFTSVFTEISSGNTLKTTMSSQDWCGQSFMQFNKKGDNLDGQLRSYFESEGDQSFSLHYTIMEDALFNMIRINPASLPVGKFDILPSATTLRLLHLPSKAVEAIGDTSLYKGAEFSKGLSVYKVTFPSLNRTLEIIYANEIPYKIEGWIDSYPSMFDRQQRQTIAKSKSVKWIDYWTKNSAQDAALRGPLGLKGY